MRNNLFGYTPVNYWNVRVLELQGKSTAESSYTASHSYDASFRDGDRNTPHILEGAGVCDGCNSDNSSPHGPVPALGLLDLHKNEKDDVLIDNYSKKSIFQSVSLTITGNIILEIYSLIMRAYEKFNGRTGR